MRLCDTRARRQPPLPRPPVASRAPHAWLRPLLLCSAQRAQVRAAAQRVRAGSRARTPHAAAAGGRAYRGQGRAEDGNREEDPPVHCSTFDCHNSSGPRHGPTRPVTTPVKRRIFRAVTMTVRDCSAGGTNRNPDGVCGTLNAELRRERRDAARAPCGIAQRRRRHSPRPALPGSRHVVRRLACVPRRRDAAKQPR